MRPTPFAVLLISVAGAIAASTEAPPTEVPDANEFTPAETADNAEHEKNTAIDEHITSQRSDDTYNPELVSDMPFRVAPLKLADGDVILRLLRPMRPLAQPPLPRPCVQHGKQLLEKLDTNKDGTADLGEIDKHIRAEMYTAEYIKNHKYTPADVEKRVKEDAEEMLDMIDSNHDKKLELQECVDHFIDDEEVS